MKPAALLVIAAAVSWSQVRPSLRIAPQTFSTLEKSFAAWDKKETDAAVTWQVLRPSAMKANDIAIAKRRCICKWPDGGGWRRGQFFASCLVHVTDRGGH